MKGEYEENDRRDGDREDSAANCRSFRHLSTEEENKKTRDRRPNLRNVSLADYRKVITDSYGSEGVDRPYHLIDSFPHSCF